MPALDGALLHRVEDLQRRHDLSRRVRGDLEPAFGQLADALAEECARAVNRIETLGEARGETPLDLRRRLRDRLRGYGRGCKPDTGLRQECATFHCGLPRVMNIPARETSYRGFP